MFKLLKFIKLSALYLIKKFYNIYYKEYNISERIIFFKEIKKNYKNYFIVFVDMSSHAINYNYVEYLAYAKLIAQNRKIILVVLPENDAKDTYEKDLKIEHSNKLRFETILKGIIDVIHNFNPTIFICKNRIDALDFFSFPAEQKFPSDASFDKVIFHPITTRTLCKEILKQNKKILVKAPDYANSFINKILLKDIKKKIVTISIRQNDQISGSKQSFYRNSNISTWLKFAEWLKNYKDFEVIIIPDIEILSLSSNLFFGYKVFREAALDPKLRLALYEKAYLNLSIAAGFSCLLYYTNCNFLVFKVGDKRIKDGANSVNSIESEYNIKEGMQLPIFHSKQKLFWGENTEEFGFIKKSFLDFVDKNVS